MDRTTAERYVVEVPRECCGETAVLRYGRDYHSPQQKRMTTEELRSLVRHHSQQFVRYSREGVSTRWVRVPSSVGMPIEVQETYLPQPTKKHDASPAVATPRPPGPTPTATPSISVR